MAPVCRIVSSDYLDKDVFLNIRCFYAAAGYRIAGRGVAADLLVVLRGDNGTAERSFRGEIHIYDYVREYVVDWPRRYPHATRIVVIALDPRQRSAAPGAAAQSSGAGQLRKMESAAAHPHPLARPGTGSALSPYADLPEPSPPTLPLGAEPGAPLGPDARILHLNAYLPVIPGLWSERWLRKQTRPLHLSNYKRMAGDAYQEDLLRLIQEGIVQVHGARWELVGIEAQPLSYRQANRRLAQAGCCFGLMWPYQRGRTLSGRMWQAPLNGCFVISELGTDILGCPGVLERDRFDAESAALRFPAERCQALQREAIRFWQGHTESLAQALGLGSGASPNPALIRRQRRQLLIWDLEFRQARARERLDSLMGRLRQRLARLARRLGLHPRRQG